MELTKAQVTEIEEYLKSKGVKYWDIRIEMLDHIATDIEQQMELGNSFEKAKENTLKNLGWQHSLDNFVWQRMQTINKRVRRQYSQEFIGGFTRLSSLLLLLFTTLFLVLLYSQITYNISRYIGISIYLIPVAIALFLMVKSFIFKKSAYIRYGSSYMMFSFFILNFILQIARDFPVTEENYKWLFLTIALINSIATYAGIKTFTSIRKEVQQMQKQLKLL